MSNVIIKTFGQSVSQSVLKSAVKVNKPLIDGWMDRLIDPVNHARVCVCVRLHVEAQKSTVVCPSVSVCLCVEAPRSTAASKAKSTSLTRHSAKRSAEPPVSDS